MTRQEFFEIAGYFANPVRNTRIEIEGLQRSINAFDSIYITLTGNPIPVGSDFVYILPNNANKWGREMRIYFTCTNPDTAPPIVVAKKTIGGRPGYDIWDQRLNNRDIIDDLIGIGFRLGNPQNLGLIQGQIPAQNLNDFDRGYNLP